MRRISHQWAGGKVHGVDIGSNIGYKLNGKFFSTYDSLWYVLLRCQNRSNFLLKSSIYFDIGFKLNGKFFSTYDILYVKFTALSIK